MAARFFRCTIMSVDQSM